VHLHYLLLKPRGKRETRVFTHSLAPMWCLIIGLELELRRCCRLRT
jgi:hypothetical protein